MSQQIATLDLTGATTNQSGTVSWAQANIHSSQQQWVKGLRPYLELVNLSACTLAISLPRGGDNMPLPAGAWHVFPLSVEEFSYTYMVLNAQQNATANKVYGWYYAAFEEAPKTGQVVNQSQALAAAAQLNVLFHQGVGGIDTSNSVVLGPSATAASFTISSLNVSFGAGVGSTFGIGRNLFLSITQGAALLWVTNLQEQLQPYFWPLQLNVPNAIPGTTTVTIKLQGIGGALFSVSNTLSAIATAS